MKKEEFLHMLEKYRLGLATEQEEAFLLSYYELFEQLNDPLEQQEPAQLRALRDCIKAEIDQRTGIETAETGTRPGRGGILRYSPWLAAAIIIVIIGFGYFSKTGPPTANSVVRHVSKEDLMQIVPGKNQAILTIQNSETIVLNDQTAGVIRRQDGVSINKLENGSLVYEADETARALIHSVTTPKGGQYKLTLSDGTRVWLNAASSIRFPSVFNQATRTVELTGEAYFEVAHDERRPFEVRSADQLITVLGTRFNVNAYADEPAFRTTLIEGKVSIERQSNHLPTDRSLRKIMKPGQQALVSKDEAQIVLRAVDAEQWVAWKNGFFKFDKADIHSVMRQIARWYDVEVEYRGKIGDDLFVGEISRDEDINNVLKIIQLNNVDVKLAGRKIIITN